MRQVRINRRGGINLLAALFGLAVVGEFAPPRSMETPVLYRFVVFSEPRRQVAEVSRDFDQEESAMAYAKLLLEQVWGVDVWTQGERIASLDQRYP